MGYVFDKLKIGIDSDSIVGQIEVFVGPVRVGDEDIVIWLNSASISSGSKIQIYWPSLSSPVVRFATHIMKRTFRPNQGLQLSR